MPEPRAIGDFAGLRVDQAIASCIRDLRAAGIERPVPDARILVATAATISSLDLIAKPERRLSEAESARLSVLLRRRSAFEPISRILGRREFYGREFLISPATLDPRPDTETVIDLVLEAADDKGWRGRHLTILDVGTGSGCILLTLLAELPHATGVGTDIDCAALAVAQRNAERLELAARVEFLQRRSLQNLGRSFDILVSNPPYIPTGEIAALEPDVRLYDPRSALDGGDDGCDIFREIAAGLAQVVPRGLVALEVGAGQAEKVVEILDPGHHSILNKRLDLAGHVRCVAMWTQS